MKWANATEADLNGALAAIKLGHDPTAAKNLIEYFYERISNGERYNERVLLEYLDHAFGKIINDGRTADQAFGLKRKPGEKKREDTFERDCLIASYMVLLIRNNWKYLDAIGEVANRFFEYGKGEKAVEAAYATYRDAFSGLSDSDLAAGLPSGIVIKKR